jgi:general secretion pathway protein L
MSRQILAIDIRKNAISAVLLNTGLKHAAISECAHVPIDPPGEPETEEAANPLRKALESLTGQMDAAAANIVVSLPMDQVIFRSLTVPFKEDNKIRQVLPFELEPILPVDVDRLTIDFQKESLGDHSRVFAVAIESARLQAVMDCFAELKLRPELVVPGGFPLAQQISALDLKVPGPTLVLDIDTHKTTLFALTAGHIALVRTLPSDITTDAGTESLALRVRQTLTALGEGQAEGFSPSAVYVSGPGLAVDESVARLTTALDLPVGTIDFRRLLTNVDISNHVRWDPHHYNNALSLAYLEAEGGQCPSFHRVRSPLRNFWTAYRTVILGPAVLLAIVMLLGFGGVFLDSYYLQKQVDLQNDQMVAVYQSTFPDSRLTAPPLDQMKSKLKEAQKNTVATQFKGTTVRTIDILLELSQLVPPSVDVIFERLTMGGDAVTVSGETADFNTVDDIKSRIEKSSIFTQVTIASANMDKSGKKVRFKLKIEL